MWRINKLEDITFITTLDNLKSIRLTDLTNIKTFPNTNCNKSMECIYIEKAIMCIK